MPYIKPENRDKYEKCITDVIGTLKHHTDGEDQVSMGELNYIISSVIWRLFDDNRSYGYGNSLVGVLECTKQEFYRRQLALFEDRKIKENGDII